MRAILTIIALAVGISSGTAHAHETRPAVVDVTLTQNTAEASFTLPLEPILAGIDLSRFSDTNDSPQSAIHDALRILSPSDLQAALTQAWPELSRKIMLQTGGTQLPLSIKGLTIPQVGDVELPRDATLILGATLPQNANAITLTLAPELGPIALRHRSGDQTFATLLEAGQSSPPLPRRGVYKQSTTEVFTHYVISGFDHIIPKGLDHILFVLGLFFFSARFRPLLWQVSAFTLAHTITLALATLGYVTISPSIVEPLIAASIAYIAIENVMGKGQIGPLRVAVIFAFGLLHGLGFASVLGDFGLEEGNFILSLVAFNIGVEAGQVAVLLGAWLLVGLWFSKKNWYRRMIAIPASVAIGIIGIYWVIERTLL